MEEIITIQDYINKFGIKKLESILTPEGKKLLYHPKWIISDLRFPSELKVVQDRNGLCIRVTRPETDKLAGNHSSETALDGRRDWDWVFDNSKDLNHLVDQVKAFVKYYKL